MAQQSTMLKIIPMICWEEKHELRHFNRGRVFTEEFSNLLTHHDAGDADAYVANDVEFTVEEVFYSWLTVLLSTDKSSKYTVSSESTKMFFCISQ